MKLTTSISNTFLIASDNINLSLLEQKQPVGHKFYSYLSKFPFLIYLLAFMAIMFFLFLLKPEYTRYPYSHYYGKTASILFNMFGKPAFIIIFGIA